MAIEWESLLVAGSLPRRPPEETPSITTFVALVPTSLVSRNGAYEISIPQNARGLTDGSDPFSFPSPPEPPLWEGAALAAIRLLCNVALSGRTAHTTRP